MPWRVAATVGTAVFVVAVAAVVRSVDGAALLDAGRRAVTDPVGMTVAVGSFLVAFALRADAWRAMVPSLSFGHALAAIHVAVGANHVLPMRLGEGLRVVSVVRRARLPLATATASTLTLRTADMLTCAAIALVGGPHLVATVLGPWGAAALVVIGAAGAVGVAWAMRLRRSEGSDVRVPGARLLAASGAAWFLEAVLVMVCARWAGLDASYLDAVVVVGTSVAAQVAAIAPGGFGTYEAAAVAAWVALGFDPGTALVAALTTHALKTAYSLVAGAAFAVWPAPGLAGRLRLPPPSRSGTSKAAKTARFQVPEREACGRGGPVVLFLPARNEAPRIAGVVRRVPASVDGRPVRCLVIDDGSTDGTGDVARAAGAEVVRVEPGSGLGAAVRTGLRLAVDGHDAAAVAFCDADGEYAPEELGALVGPILRGEADYVVGSRFAGDIERMLPHRRLGNVVLTAALSLVARRRITDGQSGYRALSPAAASAAEVVHDFNYAQVLTLDLLDKGFRYTEVPITYRFRESGRSFVRLGPYLRAVVPAVYRELNQSSTTWAANAARAADQSTSPVSVPTAARASASA